MSDGAGIEFPTVAVTADTWAIVNGREIKRDEIEKAFRRVSQPGQPLSDEEALTAKLTVLNDFIVQDILLAKARELKVELQDKELDTAYRGGQEEHSGRDVSAATDPAQPEPRRYA